MRELGFLRVGRWLAVLVALLAFAASCDDDAAPPRDVVEAPTSTPVEEPAGIGALPLDRFIYEASLTLREGGGEGARELFVSTRGIYVAPDRHSFTYRTQLGDGEAEERLVMIGDDVWYRAGDGAWQPRDLEDQQIVDLLAVAFTALRPDFLGGPEFERVRANIIGLPSNEEFVNAIRTFHYEVGLEGRQFLDVLEVGEEGLRAAEDLTWDLWLARDGSWPVRLQATGTVAVDITVLQTLELDAPTQWVIRIDIENPNDPALAIEPPDLT